MSTDSTVFGDFSISSSCATIDGSTAVPIYEFSPTSDGSYTIQVAVVAWRVGGGAARYYLQMNWTLNGGVFAADGGVFAFPNGTLSPGGITVDVSAGKGRVLVTGIAAQPLLWRMQGVRMDLTT